MQETKFFPLQWVSHSLFRLAELPYAKEFYHHNALCKIDCRVAGWGGKKRKMELFISFMSLKWKNPVQAWSRGENYSNGARVLMRPVYLVVMDLFVAPSTPSFLSLRNLVGGCAAFTFCCPGHLFWLGNEVLRWAIPGIIDTVSSEVTKNIPWALIPIGAVAVNEKTAVEHWAKGVLLL